MNLKSIVIDRLIEKAIFSNYIPYKPGEVIKRFSNEDRKIIRELKSKDFNRRIK